MPLELYPPRKDHPNWTIRGTYLGFAVDKTSGTKRESVARDQLRKVERAIERGEWPPREVERREVKTFLSAAVAYLEAGRRARYVARLVDHFGETPLSDFNQDMIDAAAVKLHPNCTPGTRNACVYTPMSAILHHAGVELKIRRPKGAKGRVVTEWLYPEDAFAIIDAAHNIDQRLAMLLKTLLYTGPRLGEALAIRRRDDFHPADQRIWIADSKNDDPRMLVLRDDLCAELVAFVGDDWTGRLFRFCQGGHLKHLLTRAKMAAVGLPCPKHRKKGWQEPKHRLRFVNFHTFCHTWATWMRLYGGADLQGLVATGRWRDARSAARYAHAIPRAEWERVESLPGPDRKAG